MTDFFTGSVFFGMGLTLLMYVFSVWFKKKTNCNWLTPVILAGSLIIILLLVTKTDYEVYDNGAKYINDFLTPATVCLAVPMYRQIKVLKDNMVAVLCGILAGCIGHAICVAGLGIAFALNKVMLISLLPKSVTTAIAIGTCEEAGGNVAIVIVAVTVAGNVGAIFAPSLLKLFRIHEPVAQGLAIGNCSHALGTSTAAVPMGEIQGAMSSLAIVVTGVMTVIIVPIVVAFLY